jgi:DNA-binding CsgD family transcriptional regulator
MAGRTLDTTARTAVDIVRDRLEQGPPEGFRLGSPQTAGRLTLLPIFHDGPRLEYVTFADAQNDGTAEITEVGSQGDVSALKVKNRSKVPVLLIDGEILVGLKQNRVLNTTILVPAKTTLKVPVACVEAGRWRHATAKAGRADYALSPKIRAMKRHSVTLSARASGSFAADQRAVWDQVAGHLGDLGVDSETLAYSDIEKQRRPEIEDRLSQLLPEPEQSGVLALVGGKPVAFDLFDRPATLARLWQGLIGSYIAESLVPKAGEESVDMEAAAEWIRGARAGEATRHQAVGLGETVSISGTGHDTSALVVEGVALHIAIGPAFSHVGADMEILTPREQIVVGLISEGLSNRAIAQRLSLSVNTVEGHIQRIYEKLGLHPDDTPPAAAAALRRPGRG